MSMKTLTFTVCTLILITLIKHLNSKQTVSVGTIFMDNTCNATILQVYIAFLSIQVMIDFDSPVPVVVRINYQVP